MNELYDNSCIGIQESSELIEFIQSVASNQACSPELFNAKSVNSKNIKNPTMQQKIEAAKFLSALVAKIIIGHFITLFVDVKLSKFAVNTIRKNRRNKKLFAFIDNEVKKVYQKHPDYKPCSAKQFMKTSMYEYFMSEWRDKTAKEKAENFAYTSIDNAITVIVKKSIPLPGSSVLAIPVKMMLTYCGFHWGIGSVYNIALEVNGETIAFGIDYRPIGFTLSNLILYTFKGKDLIGTRLKNPPESLYRISVDDAREILAKYGADADLSKIKKEVSRINSKDENIFDSKLKKINEDFFGWYYDIITEAEEQKIPNQQKQSDSYTAWKEKTINELKNNLNMFTQYAVKQTSNDIPFLQQNLIIIKNTKKFPVKPVNAVQNAPNYTAALQRINTPLSTHLNGIDLSKVEIENKDPNVNIPIKKALIPTYNGGDFISYTKSYYYGADAQRKNYNPAEAAVLIQMAYQFCMGYQTRVKSLQTDFNSIINYIGNDAHGIPNQQNPQAEINNQQIQNQNPAAQGMASTSPSANTNGTVNAAVEYENFMKDYFGDNWESLLEADDAKPVTAQQQPGIQRPSEASPAGTPVKVNPAAILMKQKQVVCDIVKDAFSAKLSALGMIYHDFIFLIRRHVASYRGPEVANQGNMGQGG